MEQDSGCRDAASSPALEQGIELCVQHDEDDRGSDRAPRPACREREREDKGRTGTCTLAPPEVERGGRRAAVQEKCDPGGTPPEEIRAQHLRQRPALQVGALEQWVEQDPVAVGCEAHPELDVLDGGPREAQLVESASGKERLASHGSEARPERRRATRASLVYVVMEKVAEGGNGTVGLRSIVVRAEDRREPAILLERPADACEHIGMDLDVRVDEHEDIARGLSRAPVASARRPAVRRLTHDDRFLGRIGRGPNRREAPCQRGRIVGRRNDDGERQARLFPVLAWIRTADASLYDAADGRAAAGEELLLKSPARSAEDHLVSQETPRTTPPLAYRIARWREERLVTLVGWFTAIAVLLAAGFLVGNL